MARNFSKDMEEPWMKEIRIIKASAFSGMIKHMYIHSHLPLLVCDSSNDDCLQSRSTRVYKDGDVVIGGFFSLYTCLYFTGTSHIKPSKDFLIIDSEGDSSHLGFRDGRASLLLHRTHPQVSLCSACLHSSHSSFSTIAPLTWLMPNNYQNVLAFIFAIEEINRNPHLLPNISLGYEFHNLLYSYWKLLESFLILYTGQNGTPNYGCGARTKSIALLTGSPWAVSSQIGPLLELYKFPQLTFGAYDPEFCDNGQFPSLYQVAPQEASLALGMVSLMLHFRWTWVGLLITEGQKGLQFLSEVRAEMDRKGACIAFVEMISNSLVSYLSITNLQNFLTTEISPVNVVIIYYDTDSLNHINQQIGLHLVTWRVWVTNSQWHADLAGRNFILDSFHGTLIFSPHHEEISGFNKFIQTATPFKYPEDTFLTHVDHFNFSLDMEQCTMCPDHQYANTQRNHCLQKAVTFLAYEDPLGKTLAGTALSLTVLTAAVLGLFVKHRHTPIVKANNRALSYTLLISLTCCFLCSLLFIGRPSTATCILQQTTFAVVFTVAVSTVLAKTITVVLAFKVTAPGRRMRQLLISGAPNSIIPICSLIQLTLCGVWMGTNPPYIDTDAHSEHGHILIVCNKGSLTAFYCVLGYLGSLALASFTVAFLARNLPDTFNEAKFLTFSMLVFCSVWVTFLPVYHSTKGKVMVAMEVSSILASGAGLLGCIFAPKCCIILLRPERNYLHGFGEKAHSGRKVPS
ncbi:PREDICTED: vomeronasal type-2 receptor 116-like [Chinchilla lanigera]|uniref:vomeronasal type-2 receptor 116-like n=1 Tax=Chinchilla lanigera TaxID=34839 RepID=UPI000697FEF1|nr:PREDICTED: vomeronasal type-2 receptor 116-like [Chinchilla lanigera]